MEPRYKENGEEEEEKKKKEKKNLKVLEAKALPLGVVAPML